MHALVILLSILGLAILVFFALSTLIRHLADGGTYAAPTAARADDGGYETDEENPSASMSGPCR